MMMLCTVPMVAFAAVADETGVEVVERSASTLLVRKNITAKGQEPVYAGEELGKFSLLPSTAMIAFAKDDFSGWMTPTKDYAYNKNNGLAVKWENPEKVISQPGTYTENIRLHAPDVSIYVVIKYTFEVLPSQLLEPAVIITNPVSEPIKYKENIKASDLTLSGGEANVPGTFAPANPNQALKRGNNQVPVTFTPDDLTQTGPAEVTITVVVDVGHPEIVSAPEIVVEYGKLLKDVKLMDLDGWVTTPATGVTVDWLDMSGKGLADERAGQVLPIGEHDDIRVRVLPKSFDNYEGNYDTVNVKVIQVTSAFPMDVSVDAASRSIIVKGKAPSGAEGTVTYTLRGNGIEQTAANKAVDEQVAFEATAGNGDYTVTAVYTGSGAQDPCAYADAEKTVNVKLPNTVTVTGGSGSGDYQAGDRVTVWLDLEAIEKNYQFKSWKITNANGETIDVGVADLTANDISFTMPDEAVNVEAVTSFSIQVFFENIGNAIMEFFVKIAEFFMGIFGGLG